MRVLVVDDRNDVADSLALILRKWGHEVRTAYCGEDALALARQWTADVVLMNISMPRIDGYELAAQMRKESLVQGRIIAESGYPPNPRRQLEAGIDAYLMKPVRTNVMRKALLADR